MEHYCIIHFKPIYKTQVVEFTPDSPDTDFTSLAVKKSYQGPMDTFRWRC